MIDLPQRTGPKPRTTDGAPHEQIDQNPPPKTYALLKDKAFDFPLVDRRPSIISVPGTEALWLTEVPEHSCVEAFMRGNEFAHVHPPYDGSMHMMLPVAQVKEMIIKGWGEAHPLVSLGRMPETTVMVFGPRDVVEVEIVLGLLLPWLRSAAGKPLPDRGAKQSEEREQEEQRRQRLCQNLPPIPLEHLQ